MAKRRDDPAAFRDLMTYQWIRVVLAFSAGLILLGLCRRADRLDPFSDSFAGQAALDELARSLSEEQEKRRRPLK